ncbi:MAG: hypothetical protein Q9190_003049 [Brigantiaea leucoxantha]
MSQHFDLSDQYKLPHTTLSEHAVIHTSIVTDRSRDLRRYRNDERWNQISLIGEGAFGEVWLQQQVDTGSLRAVKALRKYQLKRQGIDYARELEALAKFKKSQIQQEEVIVKFYGWYENDAQIFLAMEYFALGDLEKHIETDDISEFDAKQITIDVLEGLKIMHSEGFTHRDLKPQNIFVVQKTPRWWVKIGDFGITKRVGSDQTALRTETGTPYFSAPEVEPDDYRVSVRYTSAVDLWSLGCVIYNVLTKSYPFVSRKAKKQPLNTTPLAGKMSADGLAFLLALLDVDPVTRLTAAEALQSIWLKSPQRHKTVVVPNSPIARRLGPPLPPRAPHQEVLPTKSAGLQPLSPETEHYFPPTADSLNFAAAPLTPFVRQDNESAGTPVMSSTSPPGRSPVSASGCEGSLNVRPSHSVTKKKSGMFSVFKPNPNWKLLSAAESDDIAEIRRSLETGADVNTKGMTGFTALSKAAEKGNERAVRVLLENGADIDTKCTLKGTALHSAADDGLASMIKVLLEYNPGLEAKGTDGKTPLHYAARNGDALSVELLLDKGADINAKNDYKETPLWLAVDWKKSPTIRTLLERGADVNIANYEDRSPLHKAAYKGMREATRLILEKHPILDREDDNHLTPKQCAQKRKHYEVAHLIEAAELSQEANAVSSAKPPLTMKEIDNEIEDTFG